MAILEVKKLCKSFGKKEILNDISFSVEKGDIFGILGLSGVGKSTLIRCINGLETPTSGEVYYNNNLISSKNITPDKKTRQKIAMIFQSFNLLQQMTALENVHLSFEIMGKGDKDRSESKKLLDRVGLQNKYNSYPSMLSGGQKQRVAIARALALQPEILLLDEATSALDIETSFQILDLLKELNKEYNLTILIISHQMSIIEYICNKVGILDNSRLVEQGNMEDIFLNPKTSVAKKLIFANHLHTKLDDLHYIRLQFNGNSDQPLISSIVEECGITVSIYFADTKVINNLVYGQMILKLPYYEKDIAKLKKYLELKNVKYEEVSKNELE